MEVPAILKALIGMLVFSFSSSPIVCA